MVDPVLRTSKAGSDCGAHESDRQCLEMGCIWSSVLQSRRNLEEIYGRTTPSVSLTFSALWGRKHLMKTESYSHERDQCHKRVGEETAGCQHDWHVLANRCWWVQMIVRVKEQLGLVCALTLCQPDYSAGEVVGSFSKIWFLKPASTWGAINACCFANLSSFWCTLQKISSCLAAPGRLAGGVSSVIYSSSVLKLEQVFVNM